MSEKYTFDDFLSTVGGENQEFVRELHEELTKLGCKTEIKQAKSGYVVSCLQNNKTILNYVFRKKGLMVRIYPNHLADYMEVFDTISDELANAIQDAPVCKRLLDPSACNFKCAMGYDFILRGQRQQKCRSSAFLFLLKNDNRAFVKALLLNEAKTAVQA